MSHSDARAAREVLSRTRTLFTSEIAFDDRHHVRISKVARTSMTSPPSAAPSDSCCESGDVLIITGTNPALNLLRQRESKHAMKVCLAAAAALAMAACGGPPPTSPT